jgi:SAM-dependent methyltransferase
MDELYQDGEHYDRLYPGSDGIPFWKHIADEHGDPILELGCGTGRISIELAMAGHEVSGLDNAPAMFEHARQKADSRNIGVEFVRGNFCKFELDRLFGAILFPANTLGHVTTLGDFETLSQSVRTHLKPDGVYVIDIFVPNPLVFIRDPDGRYPFGQYETERGTTTVTCSNQYDAATQINHVTTYTQTGNEPHKESTLDLKMYYSAELDALLGYNGFEITAKYGTTDRDPFGPGSNRQLIVCRKN